MEGAGGEQWGQGRTPALAAALSAAGTPLHRGGKSASMARGAPVRGVHAAAHAARAVGPVRNLNVKLAAVAVAVVVQPRLDLQAQLSALR